MITARWTGLDEAIRNVRALGDELANSKVVEPALLESAQPLREDIVRTAPRSRDTEHMADTFVAVVSRDDRAEGRAVVLVGPNTDKGSVGFIAPFVEFGTSKMGARAFVRPAWDRFKPDFVPGFVARLQKRYEGVLRKYGRRRA